MFVNIFQEHKYKAYKSFSKIIYIKTTQNAKHLVSK